MSLKTEKSSIYTNNFAYLLNGNGSPTVKSAIYGVQRIACANELAIQ